MAWLGKGGGELERFCGEHSRSLFSETFHRKSVEDTAEYEKYFQMEKYANVKMVECYERKQRNVFEQTSFQECFVAKFSGGFQVFRLVLQKVQLSKERVKFLHSL